MSRLTYRANGKLLLFGEYFVMDGCTALAIPTSFGQNLYYTSEKEQLRGLKWKSIDYKGNVWFEAYFDENLKLLFTHDRDTAFTLQKILVAAKELNPGFLVDDLYHDIRTEINFPLEWGLGSSSTLIYLTARMARVDSFELFFRSFQGSGYDIACAASDKPILYRLEDRKPLWTQVEITWPFKDDIHFVYLGNKQNSREGIAHYKERRDHLQKTTERLDQISRECLEVKERMAFIDLMQSSEQLISQALEMRKIKDLQFHDFPGGVKSLGAWGGDFVMALASRETFDTATYFRDKGFHSVFTYSQMIKA